jgi:hypothetical protein
MVVLVAAEVLLTLLLGLLVWEIPRSEVLLKEITAESPLILLLEGLTLAVVVVEVTVLLVQMEQPCLEVTAALEHLMTFRVLRYFMPVAVAEAHTEGELLAQVVLA